MDWQRFSCVSIIAIFCLVILSIQWKSSHQILQLVLAKDVRTIRRIPLPSHSWINQTEFGIGRTQGHGHVHLETQNTPGQITYNCKTQPCKMNIHNFGPLSINVSHGSIQYAFNRKDGPSVFRGSLGKSLNLKSVEIQYDKAENVVTLRTPGESEGRMKIYNYKGSDCVDVSWRASKCVSEILTDCFDLGTAHWYGGAELEDQVWPLEKIHLPLAPFLAFNSFQDVYGPVEERLFFNSKGGGVYIEEDIPLFLSMNVHQNLCLQAKYDNYWYISQNNTLPELNYTLCIASNVRSIHQLMSDRYIKKPTGTPNHDVFRYPIWSTWAQYKTHINQSLVQEFTQDIKRHNFSISQIAIDDGWTPAYGDMNFNSTRFPDPKSLVDFLHGQNVSVTLWVHPFVNIDAPIFSYLAQKGWMMQDISGQSPALTKWWHGNMAGHIDFSNPDAVKWFLSELNALKTNYGIDSFKFDAGDVNFLPPVFKAHQPFLNRNHYTRLYANAAYMTDPDQLRLEVRTGARTQNLPVFVRILDRESTWTLSGGLKSVITTCLCFGIIGYPFLLPDFVGGNSYKNHPDPELYIRWVQANALMPVMLFSLLPWASNNNTVLEVTQAMVKLHEKYSDLIIQLAQQSVTTGYPIMRPLWWIAPTDEAALTVDDQFLLGDDLLVAPVVEQGQTIRRLYLPVGRWRDEPKGQMYDGEMWIDYPVTLRDLPYFTRVK